MGPETVVVTRHKALVHLIRETQMADENVKVIEHATESDITGKRVIGILPLHLACKAEQITELPLNVPPELRGKELDLEDLRKYVGKPRTYKVIELPL